MQTVVDSQTIWMMGKKNQVLGHLARLCREYGQQVTLVDLLRLLKQ